MTRGISTGLASQGATLASSPRRRTLFAACAAHGLHDGYMDLIYILLPIWQASFGLDYAALGLIRAAYPAAMACAQVPVDRWMAGYGSRVSLVIGTLVAAGGFVLLGLSSGTIVICAALVVSGIGSSTQHPRGSVIVTQAYGDDARGALGIYNFAGDLGKAAFPALTSLLLVALSWRHAAFVLAAIGVLAALSLAPGARKRGGAEAASSAAAGPPAGALGAGFAVLFVIGVLDTAPRMGFLLLLPFVLTGLHASTTTVGVALALVFAGGAFGKFLCGWVGARLGLVGTVATTESLTAALIVVVPFLPLAGVLTLLPILGIALNGTSSVLYGTVPETAQGGDVGHAFALFYTGVIGAAAGAPILFGALADAAGRPASLVGAGLTALATIPLTFVLSRLLRGEPAAA